MTRTAYIERCGCAEEVEKLLEKSLLCPEDVKDVVEAEVEKANAAGRTKEEVETEEEEEEETIVKSMTEARSRIGAREGRRGFLKEGGGQGGMKRARRRRRPEVRGQLIPVNRTPANLLLL